MSFGNCSTVAGASLTGAGAIGTCMIDAAKRALVLSRPWLTKANLVDPQSRYMSVCHNDKVAMAMKTTHFLLRNASRACIQHRTLSILEVRCQISGYMSQENLRPRRGVLLVSYHYLSYLPTYLPYLIQCTHEVNELWLRGNLRQIRFVKYANKMPRNFAICSSAVLLATIISTTP